MKFHRGSPWLSILSWLNLQANKDYFSYEYTRHVKCNVTCGSHVKCNVCIYWSHVKCNVYIYWSHVKYNVTCGPHAEGADLGGGSAVDRSAKLCRIHSLLPRVQGHDLYVYACICIYIYICHTYVYVHICIYMCPLSPVTCCVDHYMHRYINVVSTPGICV